MTNARAQARIRAGLPRRVEPELLDDLPTNDPRAIRSRKDLQRVNRLLGSATLLLGALDRIVDAATPPRFVELGAGDGTLMLRLARLRDRLWTGASLTLIDRRPCVDADALEGFRLLGWQVEVVAIDVFDWLARPHAWPSDIVIANLFVHHFVGERLEQLIDGVAQHAHAFVCHEPRRSTVALAGSHLLGAIGCNAITRHDAVLSVHAGFRDGELTSIWPRASTSYNSWHLSESAAGLFSHRFVASRAAR